MFSAPQLFTQLRFDLAEGPVWDSRTQHVYWLNIPSGSVYRCQADGKSPEEVLTLGEAVGGLVLADDGALLLLATEGKIYRYMEGRLSLLLSSTERLRGTRWNDAYVDFHGRLYTGSIKGQVPGLFCSISPGESLTVYESEIGCSNGIGLSPDRTTLYHTDSHAGTIWKYEYAADSGSLTNKTVFASLNDCMPDGLVVDREGCVWTALWGGSGLARLSANGHILQRITLPAVYVTSICFGGPELRTLFITSGTGEDPARCGLCGGRLFRLETEVAGFPPNRFPGPTSNKTL
ncbi:SMP-30/gluconolactonase/LRE family protein [Nibricoccus sp. IMCC34717]|uniref:SMP-30/gluconolactonase/LRE family protein n=1 Tax=Nibricoccus sp. IMCC34717 TaxID=3034021 RepID=UPI0038507514